MRTVLSNKETQKLQHIAIIMDGNGRWAAKRGMLRSLGHKKGAERVKEVVQAAGELGVKYLTLFAFSTENWQRSPDEVNDLMDLLRQYLKSEITELQENGVRIMFIGEREMLPADIRALMKQLEVETQSNKKLTVCIALSYGSRQEIVHAARKLATLAKRGDIKPDEIDTKVFADMLYTQEIPDPDLVIRTSGEQRLSNYLLWQIAYAELYFSEVLWPDFDRAELEKIIENYNKRERRYGKA